MQTPGERTASYLEKNRFDLINSWMAKVIVDMNDPYKDFIRINGLLMLDLTIACSKQSHVDEEHLRALAYKVSLERIQSNANIGDFVYNVTLGRSEIFQHMPRMGLSLEELAPVFQRIDILFDRFLYFAVHHYTDVKDRKMSEQESLIEQSHKDKLTILGQMSSSFVHEFRNPLTSVIGFVQLLREKYPSLEYIDIMTKELNQLKFRINQFLLVSKGRESSRDRENFEIGLIVEETLEFLYPMIVDLNVTIHCDVAPSIRLKGYPDEIRQVMINILMNSLEALSSCPVKLIEINGTTDGDRLILSISNNGPPIPHELMSTIFEPFVSGKELGTGIGLYVCRQIIVKHDGWIECESNDVRTTFRIGIPT